jgi:RHS repeat-associated protein
LVATLNAPANVRPDRNYTVWVEYGNRGGTDIRAPLFIVSSPQNLPMRLANSEPFRQGPIQVLGVNMNGPVGVLTPGSRFSIPIEFRSSTPGNQILFKLVVMVADTTPVNWATVEAEIRPPGIADDAWNAIRSNLRTRVGVSWADYLSTLTAASSYLADHYHEAAGALDPGEVTPQGRLPVPVYSVRGLLGFELAKASASISPRPVLAAGLDAFYSEPGLPLAFLRLAPSSIEQRFLFGTLGRGWAHNYEYSVRVDSDGSVAVREPWGQERLFLFSGNGAFSAAEAGEHATLTRAGQSYMLMERDGFALSFASNRLAYLEDTNGNRLTMGYTGGALTSVTHSNGDHLTIHYNARGRIDNVMDPAGRTTSYRYDSAGEHLLEVEEPGGITTTYAYRPADTSPAAHALSSITFPGGTHRYFVWDNLGRLTGEWRAGEAERLTYTYDTQGTITVHNAVSGSMSLRFGHRGQFLDSEDSEGHKLSLGFDPAGNPTRLQDALGFPAMLSYDSHGNPLGTRDLASGVTRLTYGSLDRLTSLHDTRGNRTGFGYDTHGNLESIEFPGGSREAYDVNPAGDLVSYTNRRQQTVQYDRNSTGQIIHKRFPGGAMVNYTYDALGNLDTVTDSIGTINLDYDDRGFLTRITYSGGHFLAFQYDESGRRTSRTDETGFTLHYEYDAVGRLERLRDTADAQLIAYRYGAVGRLAREERGNGTSTTYEYDSVGQILHLIHYEPNGSVQSRFDYTYDERGNRSTMTTLAGTTTYGYDALGQLVEVTYSNGSKTTYEYDAVGNRISVTANGATETYDANKLNQYIKAGGTTFTYDDDGNLTSQATHSGTIAYDYDQENRLVRISNPGYGTWEYTYDSLGNRVAATHNGEVTRYIYDPIGLVDVVAEYDGSGRLRARYIYGLGLVARLDSSGKPEYYGFDALGDTAHLTNEVGTVTTIYDYSPWGERSGSTEGSNPFRYVGRFGVMDDGSGLLCMRHRYFSPSMGRFVQADPIGLLAGQNLYTYVGNTPTTEIDPLGLFRPLQFGIGLYRFSGGLVGAAVAYSAAPATAGLSLIPALSSGYSIGVGATNMMDAVLDRDPALNNGLYGEIASESPYSIVQRAGKVLDLIISLGFIGGAPSTRGAIDDIEHLFVVVDSFEFGLDWGAEIFDRDLPDPPGNDLNSLIINIVYPIDPNGTSGPGPIIHPGERVTYTNYFENRANATAPAQEVFITDNLDSDLDWSTFQLGEVAFGNVIVNSLAGRAQGADRITYGDDLVTLEATQSSGGGQVNWVLRTLDPNTGQLPENPLAGFLPPEDGTGRGQGHVTFSVQVRADARRGTQVTNSASIVFDTNPAISTNTWTSTVQAAAVECGPMSLCLRDDRFRVDVSWRDFQGHTGGGTPHPISGESGYFTFFNEANAEIFIKVLDACALNGSFWVFDTHLSNVEYTITVTRPADGPDADPLQPAPDHRALRARDQHDFPGVRKRRRQRPADVRAGGHQPVTAERPPHRAGDRESFRHGSLRGGRAHDVPESRPLPGPWHLRGLPGAGRRGQAVVPHQRLRIFDVLLRQQRRALPQSARRVRRLWQVLGLRRRSHECEG